MDMIVAVYVTVVIIHVLFLYPLSKLEISLCFLSSIVLGIGLCIGMLAKHPPGLADPTNLGFVFGLGGYALTYASFGVKWVFENPSSVSLPALTSEDKRSRYLKAWDGDLDWSEALEQRSRNQKSPTSRHYL